VGAGAFFAIASAKPKKEHESAKKKECEEKRAQKSESAERERKKRKFCAFSFPHSGNPVQSPKPLGRGKARVLSKMYCSVGMLNLCPILAVLF
jgi:hypothetical protein